MIDYEPSLETQIEIPPYRPPTHEQLLAEQQRIQSGKFQGRQLPEYNSLIFPGQQSPKAYSSAVAELAGPFCASDRPSLQGLIAGIREAKGGPVVLVDMCGGRGLALRELAARSPGNRLINVDLFDYGFDGLKPDELAILDVIHPTMRDDTTAPEFIAANALDVELPEAPDIILGVEAIQYLEDPLGAISSWYNQLADDGWLIISAEHKWADWMRYEDVYGEIDYETLPAQHLLEALAKEDIPYAATELHDRPGYTRENGPEDTRTLIIRKKPGTRLQVNAPLLEAEKDMRNYKVAYYIRPPEQQPLIEVGPSLDPVVQAIARVIQTMR